jgi:hypothetical protein
MESHRAAAPSNTAVPAASGARGRSQVAGWPMQARLHPDTAGGGGEHATTSDLQLQRCPSSRRQSSSLPIGTILHGGLHGRTPRARVTIVTRRGSTEQPGLLSGARFAVAPATTGAMPPDGPRQLPLYGRAGSRY